jgi:DNA modification methylase
LVFQGFNNGGRFRQRGVDGARRLGSEYPTGKLARPRDVLRVLVGGGRMGDKRAYTNEAPYPEKPCDSFISACCPKARIVIEPFCGSGTTLRVAERLGCSLLRIDIRPSQVALAGG